MSTEEPPEEPNDNATKQPRPREMPDRLIPKKELLQLVPLSFPTVWKMMMAGQFPRARQIGGKTVWLKSEIDQYFAALPLRPYKGDVPQREN